MTPKTLLSLRRKRSTCSVLFTFLLTLFPTVAFANGGAFGGGDGTLGTPYIIEDCTDLQAISGHLGSYFTLANDIDCSATTGWNAGAGFAPLGSPGAMFTGNLNGNNHKITGLFMSRSGGTYIGMFSWIDTGGTVTNLGMVNPNITGSSYTGSIVSTLGGTLTNVYVTGGTVTGTNYAGGIIGYDNGGTTTFSYANTTVNGSNYAGGFVGYNESGTITNSYALSTVTGSAYPGGFNGLNLATLNKTYAAGHVSGTNPGGLVGLNSGTVTNSYYDSTTTGGGGSGNAEPTSLMMTEGTFSTWTFSVVGDGTIGQWIMAGYPHLQMEYRTAITTPVELQLMAVNLAGTYTIANNLDAVAITNYTPVGTFAAPFTGSLDGGGFLIKNLVISQSSLQSAGIFGSTSAAASITKVGYRSGSVTGNRYVGALVGYNRGAITKSFANVNVTATTVTPSNAEAGGLVGENESIAISDSYATGAVTSTFDVGGLIGYNNGAIARTFASGAVSGGVNMGGLIGRAEVATISNTFATGTVGSGATSSGGLVGSLSGGASISGGVWNSTGTPTTCYQGGDTGCTSVANNLSYFYTVTNAPMTAWTFSGALWQDNTLAYPTLTIFGDVTPPVVTNVTSVTANGSYKAGSIIEVDLTFSETVTSTGSVTVTLETGDTDRTCTLTVTGASSGSCNYTVLAGDITSDLTVSSIAGTINDGTSNPMIDFVPRTNLAANKAFVIDTIAPTVTLNAAAVPSTGITTSGDISFTATFSENMTGFSSDDVTVSNGRVNTFTETTPSTLYTFDIIPVTAGTVTVTINAGVAQDTALNDNTASASYSFTFQVQSTGGGGGGGGSGSSHTTSTTTTTTTPTETSTSAVSAFPFADMSDHFSLDAVKELYTLHVIQGKTPNRFEPDAQITRAETLKIALLLFNYTISDASTSQFSDVATSAWYATVITTGLETQLLTGYTDGTCHPDAPATRAEVLKLLLMASKLDFSATSAAPFQDVAANDWFKPYVDFAYANSVVAGESPTSFAPNAFATRAEVAVMAVRILGLVGM